MRARTIQVDAIINARLTFPNIRNRDNGQTTATGGRKIEDASLHNVYRVRH